MLYSTAIKLDTCRFSLNLPFSPFTFFSWAWSSQPSVGLVVDNLLDFSISLMAPLTFALLAILSASLASAGPVALDNSTLLSNGGQALDLNCQFQTLQESDSCTSTCSTSKRCLSFVNNAHCGTSQVAKLLAYRAPLRSVSMMHGRRSHAQGVDHASRFPKPEQMALYAFPMILAPIVP